MTARKDPVEKQRVAPDPDFDFKKEAQLDKTVPPVGAPEKPDEKK